MDDKSKPTSPSNDNPMSAEVIVGIVGLFLMILVPLIGYIFRRRLWRAFWKQFDNQQHHDVNESSMADLPHVRLLPMPRPIFLRQGRQRQTVLPLFADHSANLPERRPVTRRALIQWTRALVPTRRVTRRRETRARRTSLKPYANIHRQRLH
ncbi:hypothetical protein IWZ00DRAFT_177494 [Phyllosticta capitalensis]|uniref:Uncharacterized protein n=1 Tax=Phyllosticta capitalensis TaxID=121624 RepID=A0ABR1YZ38_9PEZI